MVILILLLIAAVPPPEPKVKLIDTEGNLIATCASYNSQTREPFDCRLEPGHTLDEVMWAALNKSTVMGVRDCDTSIRTARR